MGKKNNLGRAIIKDRSKAGRRKHGGSLVSISCCLKSRVSCQQSCDGVETKLLTCNRG